MKGFQVSSPTYNSIQATERQIPHSIDNEMCLLASMMLDAQAVHDVMAEGAKRDWFYISDHAVLFDAIASRNSRGLPVDAMLLKADFEASNKLDELGGSNFLARILGSVPSVFHATGYADVVRDRYIRRQVITAANGALRKAYDDQIDGDDLAAQTQADIANALSAHSASEVIGFDEVMRLGVESIRGAKFGGSMIPYGFKVLDRYLGGIYTGEMIVIGARPNMGKSTLMRQMATLMGMNGVPVLYVSMEEEADKIGRNVLSWETGIENKKLRRGEVGDNEWDEIERQCLSMSDLPIHVVTGVYDCDRIAAIAASMKARHGVQAMFIDYLQKLRPSRAGRMEPYERVTAASEWVQRTTKQLKLRSICAAQLNRESTRSDDKRPTMTHLRESGQIEQDADVVMLLHRPDYYESEPSKHTKLTELIAVKVRDGQRGGTYLLSDSLEYQCFEEVASNRIIPSELWNAYHGNEAA